MRADTQQVPRPGGVTLDHVAVFVPDIDAGAAMMEKLGFTVTPLSYQRQPAEAGGPPIPAGTANRMAMLPLGYVEMLTPVSNTALAQQLRQAIDRYVGLHLVALGTSDAEAAHAVLRRMGFDPIPLVDLQRTLKTENGDEATARFSVARVPPGTMPEGRIQYCRHHTPDLVWQGRWLRHANRSQSLTDVLICVADPAEAGERFARFTDRPVSRLGRGGRLISLDRGRISILDPATLSECLPALAVPTLPFMAAAALTSDDIGATAAVLEENGVAFLRSAGTIQISSSPELGLNWFFTEAAQAPPWL